MAGIVTRTSALALIPEVTEGTLVRPSSGTDFVAIQEDVVITPVVEEIPNPELKASLSPSESQIGNQDPTGGFSHTLRHSGVEGTAPGYRQVLITLFGQEDDAGVERDTVGGSTVSAINVDTGEGAERIRGEGMLVKHAANPYEIAVVDSVATDAITPLFNLQNAPPISTLLGEAITYSMLNTGHQSLSLWHYLGNQANGALAAMSGSRVTSATISFVAGEIINVTYGLEGKEYYFDPIEINSDDTYLDFVDDGGTHAAQVTAQEYQSPHDLATELQRAMNTVQTAETHSVTYSDEDGKFTIATSTSALLSLEWNTGTNAANTIGDAIGFSTAADDTGATTYESDSAQDYSTSVTPTFDSDSQPLVAKHTELFIGSSASDNVCINNSDVQVTFTLPIRKESDACQRSGRGDSIINGRETEITVTGALQNYHAGWWNKLINNTTVRMQYNFGTRTSSGSWNAGKSGALAFPQCKVVSFEPIDNDGQWDFNLTLKPFVGSGNSLSNEEGTLTMV